MDANQQRFWMLAEKTAWASPQTDWNSVEFDERCRRLRLRDKRPDRSDPREFDQPAASLLIQTPSTAIDSFGTLASWDPSDHALTAAGGLGPKDQPVGLWIPPENRSVVDLAMGFDDVLYIASEERDASNAVTQSNVGQFDPRGRWRVPIVPMVSLQNFNTHRLAADPSGGAWALDRDQRLIARFTGYPLRDGLPPSYAPTTFRPDPENADAPQLALDPLQPTDWTPGEIPIEIACSLQGHLALLSWLADGASNLRIRDPKSGWLPAKQIQDAGRPTSLAWISETRIAVLPGPLEDTGSTTGPREAIPYDPFDNSPQLIPVGGFYPLRDLLQPLFLKGVTNPPHYPVSENKRRAAQLRPLSVSSLTRLGTAQSRVIDSGKERSVWHRIYLEGIFPNGCHATLQLAATDDPKPSMPDLDWHAHLFGDIPEDSESEIAVSTAAPRGAWINDASEIPMHEGFLEGERQEGRRGLFTALIQKSGKKVRRLSGRFLHTQLILHGTGHQTPEIAAIRAYASRFSYRDQYLAEHYGEDLYGADADASGAATGSDFLERYLSLFESALTPMEDRAASAQVAFHPRSTPDEAVDWLGSWVGAEFEESFPLDRRRAWIEASHRLNRTKGTLVGLQLALEIATGGRLDRSFIADDPDPRERIIVSGGKVTGGEIIVLEDYRLRRTFATILGANLSLEDDPLLPGLIVSANSRVGDTLFIGEEEKQELLALFRHAFSDDEAERAQEIADVRTFYEKLAHSITVFVHDSVEPINFGLVERIAKKEAPAHIRVNVVRASYPLLVGLASLINVDTYLGPSKKPGRAILDQSRLGENDFVYRRASLDPRLEGDTWDVPLPIARPDAPLTAPTNETLTLDGSQSTAARDRTLTRYLWTLDPSP